ncbi:MAG: penicillin-binding protein activator LpoB [candidate division Zixibacteria bacterium]|nr:penicillin-binding protein activator LpoB [candidate division Zixibacteria bacterium]
MKKLIGVLLIACLMFACGSSRQVSRVAADTTIDLSGRWNDADSRLVSQEMVSDCLARPWVNDFNIAEGRKPAVIVGTIRNKSNEHIDTEVFTKDFERELINSGKVKFVASRTERDEIRDERDDQQYNASDETAKRLAMETGADFMLQGSIKTIVDQIEGRRVIFYQTDMELINIESNEKVWIGAKKIKKDITQKGKKW